MQALALLLAPMLTVAMVVVSGSRNPEEQKNFVGRIGSFPFMQYLANPCGIVGGTRLESNDPAMSRVHEDFEKLKAEMRLGTRLASFQLSRMRGEEAIQECNGMSLNSLPSVPSLFGIQPMEAYRLMYRDLLYLSGHLHFIAIDTKSSSSLCFNKTRAFTRQVQGLAGKLEYLLCNIIQMIPTESLRPTLEEVLDLELYHQPSCSGKATRDCLVFSRSSQFLDLIKHYLEEDRYDSNFLYQMLKRSKTLFAPHGSPSTSYLFQEQSDPAESHPPSSNSEAGEAFVMDKTGREETDQSESPFDDLMRKEDPSAHLSHL
ncbi:uncharacterized protein LOC143021286 [Oratosquilla oratoria]|uniref:uncharacterized protein LOC143021286 n=1 Tax=Oratosquilla oratoria TaxID=337810 RepID=UPI003F759021